MNLSGVLIATLCVVPCTYAQTIRIQESQHQQVIQIRDGSNAAWREALELGGPMIRYTDSSQPIICSIASNELSGSKRIVKGSCDGGGTFEREIEIDQEPGILSVKVRFVPGPDRPLTSVEDRLIFMPETRRIDTPTQGPLDFVWSQNLKSAPEDLVAHWAFKSPVVMFQQGRVFAAIIPRVDLLTAASLKRAPVALDLDVTSGSRAWFSYGAVQEKPTGHSYFRRVSDAPIEGAVQYSYWIVASAEPERLGYRRVTHLLWDRFGSPVFKNSMELQRNVVKPDLFLFDDWRREAWTRYANEKFWDFDCGGGRRCGAISSNRNVWGKWEDAPKRDAWFNSWFQNLRSAYGWYVYARRTNDAPMMAKAESVLNLALKSPRNGGAFSTIYIDDSKTWHHDDGWHRDSTNYASFSMSWTGYWMLRWAEDLVPARKAEILSFVQPYGDFLVKVQQASGVIPSWFDEHLEPTSNMRDFNAETAGSALFLAKLSELAADGATYRTAAVRAQEFIDREVVPRQRWYDFETFVSCARKPFEFYDRWTAQYPQNNLSTIQAAMSDMELYRATKDRRYLEAGTRVVDYLLLTQQVWNHPLLKPQLLGGTTTQNTDAEWSDARQCYFATLLLDYYRETGNADYLERSIAAARAGLAVAPWENWAHNGFDNEEGALTGFHWGTGSDMASVEMMSGFLGDAFINAALSQGAGFNACTVRNVKVAGTKITFDLASAGSPRDLRIRFSGLNPKSHYTLVVNGHEAGGATGRVLIDDGFRLHQ
ncbi:MAG TPA: hypothetical protein VGL53_07585 [Bryobacteraceae bacterium]